MDTPTNFIAIVSKDDEGVCKVLKELMPESELEKLILEKTQIIETQSKLIEQYRIAEQTNWALMQQNNEHLRIVLDVLLRSGLLQQNRLLITPMLRDTVRKIIDDYEFDKSLFGQLDDFKNRWWKLIIGGGKKLIFETIIKKFQSLKKQK